MEYTMILLIGYLIGCVNPAAWIGRLKNVDLRKEGSGNLGATNTALVLGRGAGLFVMVVDMLKSILSAKLSKLLFPHIVCAGLLGCLGCILGHCFPVFMGFRGGKGLAAFGGMILAYDSGLFAFILIPALILMAIFNTSVAVPITGGVLFPVLLWVQGRSTSEILLGAMAGILIMTMHLDNLRKAITNTDVITVRGFWNTIIKKK